MTRRSESLTPPVSAHLPVASSTVPRTQGAGLPLPASCFLNPPISAHLPVASSTVPPTPGTGLPLPASCFPPAPTMQGPGMPPVASYFPTIPPTPTPMPTPTQSQDTISPRSDADQPNVPTTNMGARELRQKRYQHTQKMKPRVGFSAMYALFLTLYHC